MRFLPLLLAALAIASAAAQTPRLIYPTGLALDTAGNLYVSDIGAHQVLRIEKDGKLTVIAGTGEPGYGGDDGPAAKSQLFAPHDIAFDAQNHLYIADSLNHRVRRVDPSGRITTVAGTGVSGLAGDGGPAVAAQLNGPQGLAFDSQGRLLIADTYNHVVRRIGRDGRIESIAGPGPGLAGDGGRATVAQISLPSDVAVARDGTLFIAEIGNSRVRAVEPGGIIRTVAGSGQGSGLGGAGFGGDRGPGEQARLFAPGGLALDETGNLFIADSGNNRIRVLRDSVIDTFAGSGETGLGGDGGPARSAHLNTPQKIAAAPDGRLFVADRGNGRVRVVDRSGAIRTAAGGGAAPGITLTSDTMWRRGK